MPAILTASTKLGNSGLTKGNSRDSGNILTVGKSGAAPAKQQDGTVQNSTQLACDSTSGTSGNYLEPTGQNNEKSPAVITNASYSVSTLTITCTNNFSVGMNISLNGLTTSPTLNRLNVVVATLIGTAPSYTGFTATIAGLTVAGGAETSLAAKATYTNQTRGSGLSGYAGTQ